MQIVVDGVLTNYLDVNPRESKTLLILQGWGSSLNSWVPVSRSLTPGLRIILLDLPGFGSTQPLPDGPDVPEYTLFIKRFIQKLGLIPRELLPRILATLDHLLPEFFYLIFR